MKPLKVIFAGTPEFAAQALDAIIGSHHEVIAVYTQPDRPAGRGRKLTPSPVKQRALESNIPVFQPLSLKEEQAQQQLKALNADIMVVAAYGLLLPKVVLDAPRLGCINIHASLLPRWRGAAPIQRAILENDAQTGITIMQMDVGLDTGDMLLKSTCDIEKDDTAETLHDKLAKMGARDVLLALDAISEGGLRGEKQDDALANYAKKLQKTEATIDWQQSAEQIDRQVRAFNPWPVAQTTLDGNIMRIWQAEPLEGKADASVGSIVAASKQGIDVQASNGILRIKKLQMPGGKPIDAASFLNSHSVDGKSLG